jgi:putative membrane protein
MTALVAPPPDAGTRLAVDRTRLAYERTMMAWVRTSASMISFGFTIHKFFQFRAEQGAVVADRVLGPGQFGGLMISIGLLTLLLASIEHRKSLQLLRATYGPMPRSVAGTLGGVMGALGLVALAALFFGV